VTGEREGASELALVLSTLPDRAAAERLVAQLVEERLIACGNLLPGVVSIFRWSDAVQREEEVLVLMKTPPSLVERLFQRIAELHPYEVPELVSLSVDAVSNAYCRWVRQETIEVSA
jgi:periplasmic divalent cation tolerance protein